MRARLLQKIAPFKAVSRLKKLVLGAAVVTLALALFVASLPALLSTAPVQRQLQPLLAGLLKRPVSWTTLQVGWSDGLALSGLTLGDAPPPLRRLTLGEFHLDPGWGRLESGRFGVTLDLRLRGVAAELSPSPSAPTKAKTGTTDPLTALAAALEQVEGLDFPLPADLGLRIEVSEIGVSWYDPAANRTLTLNDTTLRLALPSLAARPLELTTSGKLALDGRELGGLELNAKVSDLVTPQGRIHPALARVALDLAAPGTRLTIRGGLNQAQGLALQLHCDLAQQLAVVAPFLPPQLPTVGGEMAVDLHALIEPGHDLKAVLQVDATGLTVAGVPQLHGERLGPLAFHLQQEVTTDHRRQRVSFSGGEFTLVDLLRARWEATVDRPSAPERRAAVTFGPLRLELQPLLRLLRPFLPSGLAIGELAGSATIERLDASWQGPDGTGVVTLRDSGLTLDRLNLRHGEIAVASSGLRLSVQRAEIPLTANLPRAAQLDLSWELATLDLGAPQPLRLRGVRGNSRLRLSKLDLQSPSPWRVAAQAELSESLTLEELAVGDRLLLDRLQQELTLSADLDRNGNLAARLPNLTVTIAGIGATVNSKTIPPTPVDLTAAIGEIGLKAGSKDLPAVNDARLQISAGEFLRLATTAGLSAAAPPTATTSGELRLDLADAGRVGAAFLPPGVSAAGTVTSRWEVVAPLDLTPPTEEKNPLRLARSLLARLDRAAGTLALDGLRLEAPLAGTTVVLRDLETSTPLRLSIGNGGEQVQFDGGLTLAGVSGLPAAAAQLPVTGLALTFNGRIDHWRSATFHQEFRLDSLGLAQVAEIAIDRLAPLLDERGSLTPALLLQRLDATLFADLALAVPSTALPLPAGIVLSGEVGGGGKLELAAGRELHLRGYAETRDFGLQLGETLKLDGLRSDLLFDRVYALTRPGAAVGEWVPLSTAVLRPGQTVDGRSAEGDLSRRVRADLREEVAGQRNFSLRRVSTRAANLPLELTAMEGDLLLGDRETGLSFFQSELLGGTVRSRGVLDLRPAVPRIEAAAAFSNLDTGRLLPDEVRLAAARGGEDAAMTGDFALQLPLATDPRTLLEGLQLQLRLRRIGPAALERALFALDPYERNEQLLAQRKLLRLGGLQELRVTAADGALALTGTALAAGVPVALPSVERLRLAELPLHKETAGITTVIATLRPLLDLLRADTLLIDDQGQFSLLRR